MSLGHVGLNHLTWERSVLLDGVDVLPELLAKHADEIAPHTGMPADFIRHLGMVPSSYLRYYYAHDAVVESLRGAETRAEAVARLEAELLELYADPELDTKPPQLAQRGGAWYSEAAVDLLVSLTGDRQDVQVVNTFNHGTLPFLPDDAVIEVPAVIGSAGADPVLIDPVEPLLRGLIAHVYAYEELALDAALRGGRDRVYDALLAHPLVGQADTGAVPDRPADRGKRAATCPGPEETADEAIVSMADCGPGGGRGVTWPRSSPRPPPASAAALAPPQVRVNQVGYPSSGPKAAYAMLPRKVASVRFEVVTPYGVAYRGTSADDVGAWNATYQAVYRLSFSGLRLPGQYRVKLLSPARRGLPRVHRRGRHPAVPAAGGQLRSVLHF